MSDRPLDGIRVLDFTRVLAGPFCTMSLADMGADVVKIERPGQGDDTRAFGPPFVEGQSTYFLAVNRGKRSVVLDLKDPAGKATARRLALQADVIVENFRPGVAERLGLGAEALCAEKPGLVYCSISGFGRADPRPGYDLLIQGLSGIPSLTGAPDGEPYKCAASIADLVSGHNAIQGILAALLRRERTGEGAIVDVPMIDGQLALLAYHATAWLNAGMAPQRIGNAHPSIHPFRTYAVQGGHLNLCIGHDGMWRAFCELVERPEWKGDSRFDTVANRVRHRDLVDAMLAPVMMGRDAAEWMALLGPAGIPCGPIRSVPEALKAATVVTHAHPESGPAIRSVALPFQVGDAPRAAERGAPALGVHTDEVLEEWL